MVAARALCAPGPTHLGEHRDQAYRTGHGGKRLRHRRQQRLDVVNVGDYDADTQRQEVNRNSLVQCRTRITLDQEARNYSAAFSSVGSGSPATLRACSNKKLRVLLLRI
jgi:hypothetical protein